MEEQTGTLSNDLKPNEREKEKEREREREKQRKKRKKSFIPYVLDIFIRYKFIILS